MDQQTPIQNPSASRSRDEPPAWFTRVVAHVTQLTAEGREAELGPWDYDEDLSDLADSDDSSSDDDSTSQANSDEEMSDANHTLQSDSDSESIKSYTGANADLYYTLKSAREERKRALLREEEAKQAFYDYSVQREEEVQAACRAAVDSVSQAPEPFTGTGTTTLAGRTYDIYCSDYAYLDPTWSETESTRQHIEFYTRDAWDDDVSLSEAQKREIHGHIFLSAEIDCAFGPVPMPIPARAVGGGITPVVVPSSKGGGAPREKGVDYRFLFVSDEYLCVEVDRASALTSEGLAWVGESAPRSFVFVGIRRVEEGVRLVEESESLVLIR
ncbi:hypothetical protein B0T19DRAFT_81734 [Cercophora scortea]|uniref:Uncharacterized protein n=1 Tax=Cercophora scortea TaxID=314031 RepID=A0AAE0MMN4_9PEZI|nr:hypothetical protein B0T19DRAFT_81734 [Cercophora scortea]